MKKRRKMDKNKKYSSIKKLDKKFIDLCKKRLIEKHNELKNLNYRNEIGNILEIGDEVDAAGNDLAKEIFNELSDTQKNLLELILLALEKIDKKTYGICERCGKLITKKRLEALPWARYCINCQSETEIKKQ